MNKNWIIWSVESGAWIRAGRNGLTDSRERAGRFGFYEACDMVRHANKASGSPNRPNEAMIECDDEEFMADEAQEDAREEFRPLV